MTSFALAGRLVTTAGILEEGVLEVRPDGTIGYVGPASGWSGPAPEPVDTVAPGYVDIHCHGGGGHTVTSHDPGEVAAVAAHHLSRGTTTMLASLVSASTPDLVAAITAIASVVATGSPVIGCHVEGPFLDPAHRGAHDPAQLRLPETDELATWLAAGVDDAGRPTVRMVTLAPELPGAAAAVEVLERSGIVVGLGHTGADASDFGEALRSLRRPLVTHLFNGMEPLHHRRPGPVAASLDALARGATHAELIADGVHLADETVHLVFAVDPGRHVVLVSDAMAAAGMPDGDFELGSVRVRVANGRAWTRTDPPSLAGGTSHAADLVRRCVVQVGVDPVAAVAAASATPAALLGLDDRGSLATGLRADLVVLDRDWRVRRVIWGATGSDDGDDTRSWPAPFSPTAFPTSAAGLSLVSSFISGGRQTSPEAPVSAQSASTTRRTRTPLRLLVIGLSLVMAATFGPLAATAADPGHSGDAPYRGLIISKMRHMTLEQKVGQLFVIEVAGRDATNVSDTAKSVNQTLYGVDTPAQAIAKYRPGGVIYYTTRVPCTGCASDDNIGDPAQVATLSNGLQAASLAQPAKIPLQISVDQEGGALVARFGPPATQMPGAMALGADGSAEDARTSGDVIGTELKAVGVTQDYGVDSDVNINPNNPVIGVRSPGGDPSLVSRIVTGEIEGFHDAGESAVSKHFPGHGDTGVDSHFGLPIVTHDLATFEAIDLPPFKAAIAAGVDTIMTAHVVFPAVDPSGAPATMSHKILTGVLRDELGFKGLIVTDALDMAGATSTYPPDVAPVQAILAGADQLLIPPQMDTAYGAVLDAVRGGVISEQRLNESVYRILLHKYQHGIFHHPFVDPAVAPTVMGAPDHLAAAQAVTDRTTTLVKNDGGLLPLAAGPRQVLVTGWGVGTTAQLGDQFTKRGATTQVFQTGTTPSDSLINQVVAAAADKDLVVVSTYNAWGLDATTGHPTASDVAQTKLVRALLATGKKVVVTAMRNPYDVAAFPEAPAVLDAYGYTGDSIASLVKVIYGEVNPTGKLPVSVPNTDGSGVLYPLGYGLGY